MVVVVVCRAWKGFMVPLHQRRMAPLRGRIGGLGKARRAPVVRLVRALPTSCLRQLSLQERVCALHAARAAQAVRTTPQAQTLAGHTVGLRRPHTLAFGCV